jgi:hypothetical protein
MSKIALTPNASGTGTFTFAAPNSNSDRTRTLPDATGTIFSSADLASQAQAQAGTDNTKLMTPLRVAEAIIAQAMSPGFTSTETTLSRDGRWTFAHGLGVVPSRVQLNLRCVTSEYGFSVNDVLYYYPVAFDVNSGFGFQISADATNIYVGTYYLVLRHKTTGTVNTAWYEIGYANWRGRFLAWK